MLTPDKKAEVEHKEIEEKKAPPKEEKMFYEDWNEPNFRENSKPEIVKEKQVEQPKESYLITETFTKFGITEFLMSNKSKEDEEKLAKKEKIPEQKLAALEYIVKLPDYSYLIDANV